jgi:hypothetical protein
MKGKPVTEKERQTILAMIEEMPPADICRIMKRSPSVVYGIIRAKHFWLENWKNKRYWARWKEEQKARMDANRPRKPIGPRVKKAQPEPIRRPPAQYSNTGFLSVTQKYVS